MPGGWFTSSCGWAWMRGLAPWDVRGTGTGPGMGFPGFDGSATHCMPRALHSAQQPSCSQVTGGAFQAVSIISARAHERCTGIVPIFQMNKGILSEII